MRPNTSRERLTALLVGQNRTIALRALALGCVYAVACAALEHAWLKMDVDAIGEFLITFSVELNPVLAVTQWQFGAFLAGGLAATHAYLNEGYLPSVFLACAPVYGAHIYTIESGLRNPDPGVYLDPLAALGRTFPEALVAATLGFLLGLRLRGRTAAGPTRRSQAG